ncbi:MAG TPA: hypothetical protein VFE24_09285, partial [Pirellulales bacterium]|nr:hypothetical protein [Pirellulales bacterium]
MSAPPWGLLPAAMRVLWVTTTRRGGDWLTAAFAEDRAAKIVVDEVLGATAAITRLRDETYDAIFVAHVLGELDALEFIEGLRAGGAEDPLLVLGEQPDSELVALCYEVGGDGYVATAETTTRGLIWLTARAIERHQLIRDHRRLSQGERQRLHMEHQEADRLLHQQRALIADLESLSAATARPRLAPLAVAETARELVERMPAAELSHSALDPQLVAHYRELLRAHVIMGFGNLA